MHSQTIVDVVLDDTHRYWLDGRELDGCTSTLKAVGLIDASHYTEEARLRGSYVHDMVQMDMDGVLAEESVDAALSGYLEAARCYLAGARLEVVTCERPLADPVRSIAGKPDFIGRRGSHFVIPDWKTGSYERWHGFQTAWYEHLARVNGLVGGLVDREGVYLRPDGTYSVHPFKDRTDWTVAQAAITVVQAKRLR